MLIDCPACARSYHVSRAEIGEEGRTVVCPSCDAHWFVDTDGTGTLLPPTEAIRTSTANHRGRIVEHDEPAGAPFWRRLAPTAGAALCLVLAMGLIGAREFIVRQMPWTAGAYAAIRLPVNVRGLEIVALAPQRPADAPSEIIISGEIANVAKTRVGVPRMSYQIRDAAGVALVSWTERAPAKTLGTGKALPFVSTPHRLPPDAHSILVRFEDEEAVTPLRMARHTN